MCEREHEQIFVRANDRLDCSQSEFSQKVATVFWLQPIRMRCSLASLRLYVNDEIPSLCTARKRLAASTVFRVRVRSLFEWENVSKVASAFVGRWPLSAPLAV